MKYLTKENLLILAIILLLLKSFFYDLFIKSDEPRERVDTIYSVQTIKEKTGEFNNQRPIIIYTQPPQQNNAYINDLKGDLNKLNTQQEKINKLLLELSTRVYQKKYEDSTVSITVTDTINGRLQHQNVKWKVKPQQYVNKTIIKELKPKWSVSIGGGIKINPTPFKTVFEGKIGLKNKKGNTLQVGIESDNSYSLTFMKDVFVKW